MEIGIVEAKRHDETWSNRRAKSVRMYVYCAVRLRCFACARMRYFLKGRGALDFSAGNTQKRGAVPGRSS